MSERPFQTLIQPKRWLSITELETEFGFARSTQASMRSKRAIPYSKIAGQIRYDRTEIDRWLSSHAVVTADGVAL